MKTGRKIQAALLLLTLAFIWGHSCVPLPASAAESGRVLEMLRPVLELFVGKGNATDHLVRKLAHFTEFAALGFQILLLLRDRSWKGFLRSAELGFVAAFFDESIQILSGRGDQIIDVWLDMGGVIFGVAAASLIAGILRKRVGRLRRA